MPKNCIICPRANGSREHPFPAVLGGRRTNKGIYCGLHNKKLAPLAKILSDQLNAINAWLGVRPDHSEEPTRLVTKNPVDAHDYVVMGEKIELARPRVLKDMEMPDGTRHVEVMFTSQQQYQDWLAEQHAAGNQSKVVGLTSGYGVFNEPCPLRLILGGPKGLRAVGYVALTFLAHYFPSIARQRGLKAFKNFVLGVTDSELVWWDFDPPSGDLPEQRFRFGHRLVIGLSASRQEAYARVSFFSTLNFAACLGPARVDKDRTIIVDIDPLAERPPSDIHETKSEKPLALVERPVSLTAGLAAETREGKAEERFNMLLHNIFSFRLDQKAAELLPKINAARSLDASMRRHRVREVLAGQEQRVLNLISHVVSGYKAQLLTSPATAAIAPSLDLLIAGDPTSPTGVTQATSYVLELGIAALTAHICRQLELDDMDLPQMRSLLGEGRGAVIAARGALRPWAMQLGLNLDEDDAARYRSQ
jgi:hypothetical protein